jgi:hypothetical protein
MAPLRKPFGTFNTGAYYAGVPRLLAHAHYVARGLGKYNSIMENKIRLSTSIGSLIECIEQRSQVIQLAIDRSLQMGNGVHWRDLLPPDFLALPSITTNICNVELSGNSNCVQIGDGINEQNISLDQSGCGNLRIDRVNQTSKGDKSTNQIGTNSVFDTNVNSHTAQINQGQNVDGKVQL